MKPTFIALLALCLCMGGCGKKEPAQSTRLEPKKHKRFLWEFKTGGAASCPVIGSDGTVYVGSDDKKLYAFRADSKGLAKSPWPMRGQNARHTGRALKK